MNIVIRADSSVQLGSGHVMRCLSLAKTLKKDAKVSFICQELPGNLCDYIEAQGFEVYRLEPDVNFDVEKDAQQTLELVSQAICDWLIVDHYSIGEIWETKMRNCCQKIMVIDDLANRAHDCDVLLDQNVNPNQERYDLLLPKQCQRLLGPYYALVREEFYEARKQLVERNGQVNQILVSFGGSDESNETLKTVQAILGLGQNFQLDVVVGKAYPHLESLQAFLAKDSDLQLHVQAQNMAELMLKADLAIGSGGSSSWERACLGLPAIVLATADNQRPIAEALAQAAVHLYMGLAERVEVAQIAQAIETMQNRYLYQLFSKNSQQLCDGLGSKRLRRILLEPTISLRKAEPADCKMLFDWRNAPEIRQTALNPEPLVFTDHEAWYHRSLNMPDRHLLIGLLDEKPFGVLRYDLDQKLKTAEISIYLAPDYLGKGLGKPLLQAGEAWLKASEPQIAALEATVLSTNPRSLRLFQSDGYQQSYVALRKLLS